MSNANRLYVKWLMTSVALGMLAAFGVAMNGQEAPAVRVGNVQITGLPDDWTHHHVVFSDPGTEQYAISAGRHDEWLKIVNDPRYVLQQLRRNQAIQGPAAVDAAYRANWIAEAYGSGGSASDALTPADSTTSLARRIPRPVPVRGRFGTSLNKDWAVNMGAGAHGTAEVFPAKYTFSPTTFETAASCSDYVVFPTSVTGTAAVPNLIAYNNLYDGTGSIACTSGNPSVFWSASFENSGGTFGAVTTSPVLSINGQQAAVIVTIGTTSYLAVVLMPSQDSAIVNITCPSSTNVNASGAQGTAPKAWCAAFADGHEDTGSSPYYDYSGNNLYVGDNSGALHKFQNVFAAYGTGSVLSTNTTAPSEVGNPFASLTSTALASPVYDGSTYVFVGSAYSGGTGDVLYSVVASSGAKNGTSSQLGHGPGIVDAPLVDPVQNRVYVSVSNDGSSSCSGNGCSLVYQFPTTFTSGTGASVTVGNGAGSSAAVPMYSGAFNNAYYSSAGGTGELYVCGNTGNGSNGQGNPKLYGIAITTNTMGTVSSGLTLTSGAATCSPVTEVFNGSNDWLFLSVTANGNLTGCNGAGGAAGCVYNFNAESGVPSAATAGIAATSGASGIIIDNVVNNTGASQIYYEELSTTTCSAGAGGCAVQTTQANP